MTEGLVVLVKRSDAPLAGRIQVRRCKLTAVAVGHRQAFALHQGHQIGHQAIAAVRLGPQPVGELLQVEALGNLAAVQRTAFFELGNAPCAVAHFDR